MDLIGKGISYLGLFIIFSGTFGQRLSNPLFFSWNIAGISIAIGLGVLIAGIAIISNYEAEMQIIRNEEAKRAFYSDLAYGKDRSLYLRSFEIDGKFLLNKEYQNIFDWNGVERPGEDAIERILSDALIRTAPLFGLGNSSNNNIGFGNAGLSEDWKSDIVAAMEKSTYIFIVPSFREGILWEIGEILRRDYICKTVFVMPPTNHMIIFNSRNKFSEIWENTVASCKKEYGLIMPNYTESGAVFLFGEKMEVTSFTEFKSYTPMAVAKTVNNALGYDIS